MNPIPERAPISLFLSKLARQFRGCSPHAGWTQTRDDQAVGGDSVATASQNAQVDPQRWLFEKHILYLTTPLTDKMRMVSGGGVVACRALAKQKDTDFAFSDQTLQIVVDGAQANPRQDTPSLPVHFIRTRMRASLTHSLIDDLKLVSVTLLWPLLHDLKRECRH